MARAGVADAAPPAAGEGAFGSLRTVKRLHQLINTATGAHDNMAIAAFRNHVVRLPAGGYGTTQFDMTDAEREALLEAGRAAMRAFLGTRSVLELGGLEPGGLDLAVGEMELGLANDAVGTLLQR